VKKSTVYDDELKPVCGLLGNRRWIGPSQVCVQKELLAGILKVNRASIEPRNRIVHDDFTDSLEVLQKDLRIFESGIPDLPVPRQNSERSPIVRCLGHYIDISHATHPEVYVQ
jgi:hypothetical protein